jgi:hypothetical protein
MRVLQSAFYVALGGIALYLVCTAILAFRTEVHIKYQARWVTLQHEMDVCRRHYEENRCGTLRMPALEASCKSWEACMGRDAASLGTAKIAAETLAEILNSFFEPISLRTIAILIVATVVALFLASSFLSLFRSRYLCHPDERRVGRPLDYAPGHFDALVS